MLNRAVTLLRLKGAVHAVPSSRSYNGVSNWKRASMDEYMVPSGCWKENYDKMNMQFTKFMIAGAAFLAFTIYSGYQLGPLKFYTAPNKYDFKAPDV